MQVNSSFSLPDKRLGIRTVAHVERLDAAVRQEVVDVGTGGCEVSGSPDLVLLAVVDGSGSQIGRA